jgi:hypothetical protein
VNGLWTVRSEVRFLTGVTDFIFSRKSTLVRSPLQPPVHLVSGAVFLGQAAGREADLLPPSSAEVKNKWRYTSTPLRCHYGLERDRVPFTVFYGCSLD